MFPEDPVERALPVADHPGDMPDTAIDTIAIIVAVLGAMTFALMIWAAHKVDGR